MLKQLFTTVKQELLNFYKRRLKLFKLGLDVHGVIDDDPEFFSDLSKTISERGHYIYIVTGREETSDLVEEIKKYGISHIAILSITSHQKTLGTPISYLNDRRSQPIMDPEIWNPTKAALCATVGIDVMIDDSLIYGKYFQDIKTQYITYTPQMKEFLRTLFYYGGYDLRGL